MIKNTFIDLINNFNGKTLNENYIDYTNRQNAPSLFMELLKTTDLNKRNAIWQTIQDQVKPEQVANPYYVGFGNPNSDILIIGKELGFDIQNKTQFFNESIQNIFQWESYIKDDLIKDEHFNSCLLPYLGKLPKKEGHTWRKYNKLIKNIVKDNFKNNSSFLEHCFLTEYNYIPSPISDGKSTLTKERKELLEHDFYKSFKIIINSARAYDEGYMDKIFNVKWLKTDSLGNSKRKYLLYENKIDNRKLIMIDQLSGAWSDDDLMKIAKLLTD